MTKLPSGTVTFLFTDVEDSTPLWEQSPSVMRQAMDRHDELIDSIATEYNGFLVRPRGEGDSRFLVFERARDAVRAGLAIQQSLRAEAWKTPNPICARMGIHTGEGKFQKGDYYGSDVVRCARLRSIAHGGQTVLSRSTYDLLGDDRPGNLDFLDLGKHRLRGLKQPEHVFQLTSPDLPSEFPPLKSQADIAIPPAQLPAFLDDAQAEPQRPTFVARQQELDKLNGFLNETIAHRGSVALVSGGAGRGKTALLDEFTRQAMDTYPDLLAVVGNCNAFSGVGDPYLPFREIMGMLTGDIETRWKAGLISTSHVRRIWAVLPDVFKKVLEFAPDLLNRILRGVDLLSRVMILEDDDSPRLDQLREIVYQQQYRSRGVEHSFLIDQYTTLLRVLSDQYPLLLILDDAQWMDTASIGLLFYLGRHLADKRILIVCAYRPEEVIPDRDGNRHTLEKIINEFKRLHGDISVDLNQIEEPEGRRFVDAFLETDPNDLKEGFRTSLLQHTDGHPLFTIELLRAMQDRGDLVRDSHGRWIEGDELDWKTLPTQVEAVIEERISRLDDALIEILKAACVEGEEFTVHVVAKVQGISERDLLSALSLNLEKRHHLVREAGEIQVGNQLLSRYTFAHTLFQHFLYIRMSARERQILHGEIAITLEDIYQDHSVEIAVLLSKHFLEAAMPEKAKNYLLHAGHEARTLYAHEDAEKFYQQAISIMQGSGQDKLVAETKHALGLVHLVAGEYDKAAEIFTEDSAHWDFMGFDQKTDHQLPPAVLNVAIEPPTTLDPGLVSDDVSAFMSAQLFEGLVRVGKDHSVLPAVASRWQVADGGKRYTFHLRNGLLWSDGTPITAGDFEYAWKRNLDSATRAPRAHLLYPIKNSQAFREGAIDDPEQVAVSAQNDLTLVVNLENPTAYFPYLLALPVTYPLPRWAIEKKQQNWSDPGNLVNNGFFNLEDFEDEERIVLAKNSLYQGRSHGNVEQVECLLISTYMNAIDRYANNEISLMTMVNADPGTITRVRQTYRDELIAIPRPATFFLVFLVNQSPFDDVRVRQAFVHAVDRDALALEAFQGLRQPATGGFIPPGMPGYSKDIGLPNDPSLAKQLLRLAGFPDGNGFPEVSWIHATGSDTERVIPFLQTSWHKNLGVKVLPQSMSWGELNNRLENDPAQLTLIGWSADYLDPHNFLHAVFHSEEGLNDPRWQNQCFDTLVEEAACISDQSERIENYKAADNILVADETAIMPLSYSLGRMLCKPHVKLPEAVSLSVPLNSIIIET